MASFYRKPNGSYLIRVSDGIKNGKPYTVSKIFKPTPNVSRKEQEKEVEEFAVLFEALVHSDQYVSGVKSNNAKKFGMTLKEFVDTHYFNRIQNQHSPNNVEFYRSVANKLILPNFGDIRLYDITADHLQGFSDFLASPHSRADENNAEPLSGATVRRYSTVFSSIINLACEMGFLKENPFHERKIYYPKIQKPRLNVYDEEESNEFFVALQNEDPKIKALLLCALVLGMRRAEMIGLKWEDVDFKKRTIDIYESAVKERGKKQDLKDTKTESSIRTLFMPECVSTALSDWKEQQAIIRKNSKKWNEQGYIFTNEKGNAHCLDWASKKCKKVEDAHDLRYVKLHELRHTCASLMIANDIDIETVRSVLGHADISTTYHYVHPYEKNIRNATNKLEKIITTKESEENN